MFFAVQSMEFPSIPSIPRTIIIGGIQGAYMLLLPRCAVIYGDFAKGNALPSAAFYGRCYPLIALRSRDTETIELRFVIIRGIGVNQNSSRVLIVMPYIGYAGKQRGHFNESDVLCFLQ